MKIGIDISQIVYQGTGVARFTTGLVNAILNYDQNNQWLFFFSSLRRKLDPNLEKQIVSKKHLVIKYPLPPTLLSILWNDLHLLSINKIIGPTDWFISSDWTEPPCSCNKVAIVHDLIFIKYPDTVANIIKQTQRKRLSWVKKESDVIFADSQSTKNDLINLLNINQKKIIVNYPGVEVTKPDQNIINQTLKKFKLTKPFILTVGKLEPRKNLERLIKAYNDLGQNIVNLVIVGPKGWDSSIDRSIEASINIKLLGLISDQELYSLYSSCLFFVYPSLYEGFGYPIIEAMRLSAPVTTSNTSSLTEIGQDAALFFDPLNVDSISQAMKKMIEDNNLRKNLINKSKSKKFSWSNYYLKMIKTLYDYRD